jgi:hypothetical protein
MISDELERKRREQMEGAETQGFQGERRLRRRAIPFGAAVLTSVRRREPRPGLPANFELADFLKRMWRRDPD